MSFDLVTTLSLACLLLAGLGCTALLVDRDMRRRQALQARLAKAKKANLRTRPVALRSLLRTAEARPQLHMVDVLANLPGFDVRHRAEYPRGWGVLLIAGLLAGRLATALALEFVGPFGWLLWPVAAVAVIRWSYAWQRAKRDAALLLQFPDALGMLVRSVRAGLPLTDAIRVVAREAPAPTSEQFQVIVSDLMIGMGVASSLARLARRTSLAEYHFFATALTVQSQTGGKLSETLDGLAEMIRKRVAAKDRALALASEARTSALILASLPVLAAAGLSALNWPYMSVLFTDPQGHMLLGGAAGSLGFGLLLMHTIIRKSVT